MIWRIFLAWTLAGPLWAACEPDRVELRGAFGKATFSVEIADDADERAVGLMNRETMPLGHGMLFIYEQPHRAGFWMRNTLIPLDMIFFDQTGVATRIHENAVPLDETPIDGGPDVLMILEINGGLADRIGLEEGLELRHPAVDQSAAAWPCPE